MATKKTPLVKTVSGAKLPLKQKRFAEAWAKHGNGTQAYIDAGYSANREVARREATKLLSKPDIRNEITAILAKNDLSIDRLSKDLRRSISYGMGEKPTNSDALRGIEMALRLNDAFPADRKVIDQRNLNLSLKDETTEGLTESVEALIAEVKEMKQLNEQDGEVVE